MELNNQKIQLRGAIKTINPKTTRGANNFEVSSIHLEFADNPEYPQIVKIEFGGKNASLPESYTEGDTVIVDFNLRGRETTNKKGELVCYTNLDGYRMTLVEKGSAPVQQSATVDDDDDLPF